MTEPTEPRPSKRTLPPDLQGEVEDIQKKVPRTAGPLDYLDKRTKRWLIVGICLHTIISPVLRTYVVNVVTKLCYSLTSRNNIHKQTHGNYLKRYSNTELNYAAINNNKTHHGWNRPKYDYRVKSPVDLSRLFLQTHMAYFTAFDDSCDSSALLGIIVNIDKFPVDVRSDAQKIRSDIRNPWAHCQFRKWTAIKYSDTFKLMRKLIKHLSLSSKEEHRILGKLKRWAKVGKHFLSETKLDSETVKEICQHLHFLCEYIQTASTKKDNQVIKLNKQLKDLQNGVQEHGKKIDNLENIMKNESKLPLHDQEIIEWVEDQNTFFETRATRHILRSLQSNNCIVVTGSSGCGKSSNIHHAALHLRDSLGYEIIPVLTGPIDILNYYNKNKNQVFVVDDIWGKETINMQTLKTWRDKSEQFEKIFGISKKDITTLNDGTVSSKKLLISCRLHIYKEVKDHHITNEECNLLSEELCLVDDERMCMLQKYISNDVITKLNQEQVMDNVDFFPLLCKLSRGKTLEELKAHFTAPLGSIKRSISTITEENKFQLCALTLCVLFEGGFDIDLLTSRSPSRKKDKLIYITNELDIKLSQETHSNALKLGFFTLNSTYIKLRGTMYRIIHDKIFKLAAVICGQHLTECFIKYAPSVLIRDRFIFESLAEVHSNDDSIVLLKTQEEDYFERLVCDLKHDNITSTFNNNQLVYQLFINELIMFFSRSDDAKSVLKNLDTKKCVIEKKHLPLLFKTTPLIESASRGYFSIVQFMIDNIKCNVKSTDSRGRSPLHKASQKGHSNVVKLLLGNKADTLQCDIWGKSPFHLACEGGYTDTVKLLLQYNADVFQCDKDKRSPLHVSCKGGHTDTAKLLLQKNADIFQCDIFETSPFYMACKGGYTETVELLLQYNADVFRCDTHHKCPLHVTCEEGHVDILNLLLQNDADISQCSHPLLHFGCKGGHIDIVKILLQYNADVLQCDRFGNSPLFVSCEEGHIEIVELLLQNNADVTVHEDDDDSPLYVSCQRGYIKIVKLLLQNNADVSQWGLLEESPLHAACANGYADIVELLLQYNADVSMCSYDGNTPLFMAVIIGHTGIVKLLIEKNADPSTCNNDGESPMFVACERGYLEIVEIFLKNNCDVFQWGLLEESPLHAACANGHADIVNMLLRYNADPSLCNKYGETPLYVACKNESIEIVRLLLKNNPDASQFINDQNERIIDTKIEILYSRQTRLSSTKLSPIFVACQQKKTPDIAKLLVQHRAVISRCNNNEESPLFVACQKCNIDIVKLLLQYDADVSHCNNDGESPLYKACEGGSTDLVALLLLNQADPSRFSNNGTSPLFVACQEDNIDIVELLLQYDVDISHCNNNGESPLYIACEGGSTDLVKLLLQNKADISHCNTNSQSSLYVACKESHVEIVKYLLENKADISQCEKKDGRSPLHVACDIDLSDAFQFIDKDSRIEIVKLLLAWNADASICDKNGQTSFDIARKSQCEEIISEDVQGVVQTFDQSETMLKCQSKRVPLLPESYSNLPPAVLRSSKPNIPLVEGELLIDMSLVPAASKEEFKWLNSCG
ncbi:uncharacterized protein LOC134695304 [Mytilus trossulus]|uniref:uncharacterized protein LOC134695304 n=1 Tax=Mytilus trossulus TaxID=6551 RepID=UPI0030073FD2